MKLTLKIWRQKDANDKGKIVDYQLDDVSPDMSFLEMLDVLNQELIDKDDEPIALIMIVEKEFVVCVLCT